ncbi:unnamed protein product [Penicillium camemberti]|uniref:Str. FM013 n=1 Tax=Penicillium camemberti (strain FM 013) TaxID=1429867 RepID=A0A0G4PPG7_PENC3|nr:unnamed protein product [Penicillium camemberti]
MHICLQTPQLNTEFGTPIRRAERAIELPGYAEINGLTQHQLMGYTAGPVVLTLRQDKQDNTGTASEGYIDRLVWEKVPGESMDAKNVRAVQRKSRTDISLRSKAVYR